MESAKLMDAKRLTKAVAAQIEYRMAVRGSGAHLDEYVVQDIILNAMEASGWYGRREMPYEPIGKIWGTQRGSVEAVDLAFGNLRVPEVPGDLARAVEVKYFRTGVVRKKIRTDLVTDFLRLALVDRRERDGTRGDYESIHVAVISLYAAARLLPFVGFHGRKRTSAEDALESVGVRAVLYALTRLGLTSEQWSDVCRRGGQTSGLKRFDRVDDYLASQSRETDEYVFKERTAGNPAKNTIDTFDEVERVKPWLKMARKNRGKTKLSRIAIAYRGAALVSGNNEHVRIGAEDAGPEDLAVVCMLVKGFE